MSKAQRIRDPVHNLIEFDDQKFEQACWSAIQTKPFQRLRRIKQLGFSELVYPGATHSRLSHSLGVFHTARQISGVIQQRLGGSFDIRDAQTAIAAALVHDVGHGPFSHSFEEALKEVDLDLRHEIWTERIIRETGLRQALDTFTPGFADTVASVIKSERPLNIYSSIVSSQFDADRLDYMQRDRMMTGTQQGAIDFRWLLANLEVHRVTIGKDEEFDREVETLVLGPKATMAAEAYVLGLFQLYPTIYLHKATRGAEKLFSRLLVHIFRAVRDNKAATTGLPVKHPIVQFAKNPADLERYLALDDTVVWGALPLLRTSSLPIINCLAARLAERRLYRAINITLAVELWIKKNFDQPHSDEARKEAQKMEALIRDRVTNAQDLTEGDDGPAMLQDVASRNPYKRRQTDDGVLERINALTDEGKPQDLANLSAVVASLKPFHAYRIYFRDESSRDAIQAIIKDVLK